MKAYTQSYVMREHPMAGAVALHWSRLEAAVSLVSLSAGFNLQERSVNLRKLNAAIFTRAKKRKACDCDRVYKHLTLSWGKKKTCTPYAQCKALESCDWRMTPTLDNLRIYLLVSVCSATNERMIIHPHIVTQ